MLIFGSPGPQFDQSSSKFCVNRNCLLFEVHQIISQLLRDFLIFVQKADLFAKSRLFKKKEDLICVVFSKRSAKQTQVC